MRRYHHIGIPTTESKPEETHLKDLKLFVVSHQKSEFGVGWMRFEADAAVPDLVRRVPHVPFEVTDLSSELALREILIPRNSPISGGPRRVHRRKRHAHRTARIYRPQTPSPFIEPNGRVTGYPYKFDPVAQDRSRRICQRRLTRDQGRRNQLTVNCSREDKSPLAD